MAVLNVLRLDATIRAADIPINGVSLVDSVAVPDFAKDATPEQRQQARAIVLAFDWSDAAQEKWEEDQHPERRDVRQLAADAIAANDAFLAIASPSNTQNIAQVKRLTQQISKLIKLAAKE